jgi:16S rRNA G527 N7-methylase RsmG
LKESSIPLESEIAHQLAVFLALLNKWNSRINLTSSTEWHLIGPMFREAIWASRLYPAGAISHMDIGSGAGFPALLLKAMIPRIDLELVENRGKKSQFLETAAHAMGLGAVRVHHLSLSDYLQKCGPEKKWDCISWKALKLKTEDLFRLHAHTHRDTQLWMFHGREAALEDSQSIENRFCMVRNEKTPGMRKWELSIYQPL